MAVKKRKRADKRITHSISTFIKTGKINPSIRGYRKLQSHLLDIENSLIIEQGGPGITAKEEILIKCVIEGYGILMLGNMYVKKYGVLSPGKLKAGELQYQAILGKSMVAYQNTIRQNIMALESLKRDDGGKPVISEAEFVQEIEGGEAEKVPDDTAPEDGA